MEFEWDEAKSDRNRRERGFGFDYAAGIFDGPILEEIDLRRPYGETRIRSLGQIGNDVFFVTYTDRIGVRRIISARKASKKERTLWHSFANR